MKKIIEMVLERHKDRQTNLASEGARKLIAAEIEAAILSKESDKYPTDVDIDKYLVEQYNRNRPTNEHITNYSEIQK
jgi:hypothetical protein